MENLPRDSGFELKTWLSPQGNQIQKENIEYYDRILILAEALNVGQGSNLSEIQKKRNKVLESEPKLACQHCVVI